MKANKIKGLLLVGSLSCFNLLGGWAHAQVLPQETSDVTPGATIVAAPIPAPTPNGISLCNEDDKDCRYRILSILTQSPNIGFPPRVEAGVRLSIDQSIKTNAAISVSDRLASLSGWAGEIQVLPFEMVVIPNSENFRVHVMLADSEVALICKRKDDGSLVGPYASMFMGSGCQPDGTFGVSARLFEFLADATPGRAAMRWAEIKAVVNFSRNGFAEDYLRKRILAYAGISADTVWAGNLSSTQPNASGSAVRGDFGMSGVLMSDNNHWEVRGFAGYRPNLANFNDYGVDTRLQLVYRLLIQNDYLIEMGAAAQYSHWSIPGRSIGTYASDRTPDSLYLGTTFGFYYNPAPTQ